MFIQTEPGLQLSIITVFVLKCRSFHVREVASFLLCLLNEFDLVELHLLSEALQRNANTVLLKMRYNFYHFFYANGIIQR